jgi:hypothetical protein
MANYKIKEGVKCFPFGAHCKEVVNELSSDPIEAENQMILTDELAEYLIESEKVASEDLEVNEEVKPSKKK